MERPNDNDEDAGKRRSDTSKGGLRLVDGFYGDRVHAVIFDNETMGSAQA